MKDLSKKNPYAISHFRKLELKYFCMQYSDWEKEECEINLYLQGDDPTGELAIKLSILHKKKQLIKDACTLSGDISGIIFEAVTKGRSYDVLEARRGTLPWSRTAYYNYYRRFMYILHMLSDGVSI